MFVLVVFDLENERFFYFYFLYLLWTKFTFKRVRKTSNISQNVYY